MLNVFYSSTSLARWWTCRCRHPTASHNTKDLRVLSIAIPALTTVAVWPTSTTSSADVRPALPARSATSVRPLGHSLLRIFTASVQTANMLKLHSCKIQQYKLQMLFIVQRSWTRNHRAGTNCGFRTILHSTNHLNNNNNNNNNNMFGRKNSFRKQCTFQWQLHVPSWPRMTPLCHVCYPSNRKWN